MSKKIDIPKAVKGRGYVGVWASGQLGWGLPDTVGAGYSPNLGGYFLRHTSEGDRAYLCEITIKPVLDAKGRPITRVKHEEKQG